jgi:two-component system nitrate/nitrite response regulator NarL
MRGPVSPDIRVVIVSDVRLHREGLALCLGGTPGIDLVATAPYGADAADALERHAPDVAVLDLAVDGELAFVRILVDAAPRIAFVLLAVPDLERAILDCAEAGIAGYITRDGSIAELVGTIRRVSQGEALYSPHVVARLLRRIGTPPAARHSGHAALTTRERQVAALLEDGLSNKEIARRLSIELPTVKNHVHSILDKLGVNRRGEAVARLRDDAGRRLATGH